MEFKIFDVAVVGGGIAAVEAIRYFSLYNDKTTIAFVSGGTVVQAITSIKPIFGTVFDVELENIPVEGSLKRRAENVVIFPDRAIKIIEQDQEKKLLLSNGAFIKFDKLLLCTGAVPKSLPFKNDFCLTLRDTQSARILDEKVRAAERVVLIGNGGIALELVHSLQDVEIIWCSRNQFGRKFLDEGAIKFLLESKSPENKSSSSQCPVYVHNHVEANGSESKHLSSQAALGPHWYNKESLKLTGSGTKGVKFVSPVDVVSIKLQENHHFPVKVSLSNGQDVEASFCIYALGVISQTSLVEGFAQLDSDCGVLIDQNMQSISTPWLYAAGDCCTCHDWPMEETENWIQMRLWKQAGLMGSYAAKSILNLVHGLENMLDYSFMNFSHVTSFFGYRTVLLGLYNGQTLLESDCEYLFRITKDNEYIKVILKDDTVRGCTLIYKDHCELEEVLENLISNQIVLGPLKNFLLDDGIDIADYFD